MRPYPSPERLRELLIYQPDTGLLFWRKRDLGDFANERCGKTWNTRFSGKQAINSLNADGYFVGTIDGRSVCFAHLTGWSIHTGLVLPDWREFQLDHRNGITADNTFDNLRMVKASINQKNRIIRSGSRYPGVYLDNRNGRWRAKIKVNYRTLSLGGYDTFEDARAARQEAEKKHGFITRALKG